MKSVMLKCNLISIDLLKGTSSQVYYICTVILEGEFSLEDAITGRTMNLYLQLDICMRSCMLLPGAPFQKALNPSAL